MSFALIVSPLCLHILLFVSIPPVATALHTYTHTYTHRLENQGFSGPSTLPVLLILFEKKNVNISN